MEKLDLIIEKLERLDGRVEELHAGHQRLDGRVEELHAGHQRLEGRVEELHAGHKRLEGSVEELHAGHKRLEGSVEELHAGHQRLEGSVEELRTGQQRLEGSVEELRTGQQRLEGGQASLVTGLMETNQIVRAIRDRQEVTDAKLEAVSMDVNMLVGKVEGNSAKLDVLSADLLTSRRDTKNNFLQVEAHQHVVYKRLNSMEERIERLERAE